MFQFAGFPPVRLCIHRTVHELSSCGFPHSDICGSSDICSLPQLFAACHVFLRLPVPRASALRPYSLNLSAHSVALPGFVKTSSSFPLYVSLCFRNLICIRFSRNGLSFLLSGSRLLSRAVPGTVPSAAMAFTVVFGMGTGVSPWRITAGISTVCP